MGRRDARVRTPREPARLALVEDQRVEVLERRQGPAHRACRPRGRRRRRRRCGAAPPGSKGADGRSTTTARAVMPGRVSTSTVGGGMTETSARSPPAGRETETGVTSEARPIHVTPASATSSARSRPAGSSPARRTDDRGEPESTQGVRDIGDPARNDDKAGGVLLRARRRGATAGRGRSGRGTDPRHRRRRRSAARPQMPANRPRPSHTMRSLSRGGAWTNDEPGSRHGGDRRSDRRAGRRDVHGEDLPSVQVLRRIEADILTGRLKPGSRLAPGARARRPARGRPEHPSPRPDGARREGPDPGSRSGRLGGRRARA